MHLMGLAKVGLHTNPLRLLSALSPSRGTPRPFLFYPFPHRTFCSTTNRVVTSSNEAGRLAFPSSFSSTSSGQSSVSSSKVEEAPNAPSRFSASRLLIIDGSGLLCRCFFAIPPQAFERSSTTTTITGGSRLLTVGSARPSFPFSDKPNKFTTVNAFFGFVRSLRRLLLDFYPSHLVVVFDAPDSRNFRTSLLPSYKSQRPSLGSQYFHQIPLVMEFCKLSSIAVLQICGEGMEGDDVIASLVHWAQNTSSNTPSSSSSSGFQEVLILSSDKDVLQLISPTNHGDSTSSSSLPVNVVQPHCSNRVMRTADVMSVYGISPSQFKEYLAMTGDKTDNIPGVPGLGPKRARTLLAEYGSVQNLLDCPNVTGDSASFKRLLEKHKSAYTLASKLVHLNILPFYKDIRKSSFRIPLPVETNGQPGVSAINAGQLRRFFSRLRLQRLMDEWVETLKDLTHPPRNTAQGLAKTPSETLSLPPPGLDANAPRRSSVGLKDNRRAVTQSLITSSPRRTKPHLMLKRNSRESTANITATSGVTTTDTTATTTTTTTTSTTTNNSSPPSTSQKCPGNVFSVAPTSHSLQVRYSDQIFSKRGQSPPYRALDQGDGNHANELQQVMSPITEDASNTNTTTSVNVVFDTKNASFTTSRASAHKSIGVSYSAAKGASSPTILSTGSPAVLSPSITSPKAGRLKTAMPLNLLEPRVKLDPSKSSMAFPSAGILRLRPAARQASSSSSASLHSVSGRSECPANISAPSPLIHSNFSSSFIDNTVPPSPAVLEARGLLPSIKRIADAMRAVPPDQITTLTLTPIDVDVDKKQRKISGISQSLGGLCMLFGEPSTTALSLNPDLYSDSFVVAPPVTSSPNGPGHSLFAYLSLEDLKATEDARTLFAGLFHPAHCGTFVAAIGGQGAAVGCPLLIAEDTKRLQHLLYNANVHLPQDALLNIIDSHVLAWLLNPTPASPSTSFLGPSGVSVSFQPHSVEHAILSYRHRLLSLSPATHPLHRSEGDTEDLAIDGCSVVVPPLLEPAALRGLLTSLETKEDATNTKLNGDGKVVNTIDSSNSKYALLLDIQRAYTKCVYTRFAAELLIADMYHSIDPSVRPPPLSTFSTPSNPTALPSHYPLPTSFPAAESISYSHSSLAAPRLTFGAAYHLALPSTSLLVDCLRASSVLSSADRLRLQSVWEHLELPLINVLCRIERHGVFLDPSKLLDVELRCPRTILRRMVETVDRLGLLHHFVVKKKAREAKTTVNGGDSFDIVDCTITKMSRLASYSTPCLTRDHSGLTHSNGFTVSPLRLVGFDPNIYNVSFNPCSPKQVGKLFFELLHLQPLRLLKDRKSASTSQTVMRQSKLKLDQQIRQLERAMKTVQHEESYFEMGESTGDSDGSVAVGSPMKESPHPHQKSLHELELIRQLIHLVAEYRDSLKIQSLYLSPLPSHRDATTGRIHCTYSQTGTATGRLACLSPNLQNIPKAVRAAFLPRGEVGGVLRDDHQVDEGSETPTDEVVTNAAPLEKSMVSTESNLTTSFTIRSEDNKNVDCGCTVLDRRPYNKLVSIDFRQMELRLLAYITHDILLLDALQSPDPFTTIYKHLITGTATSSWSNPSRLPPGSTSGKQRSIAKTVTYAILYGQTADGLSTNLEVSREEAEFLLCRFHAIFPNVQKYMKRQLKVSREHGYCRTLVGRVRLIDGGKGGVEGSGRGRRLSMNTPIQGLAADVMKHSLIGVFKALDDVDKTKQQSVVPCSCKVNDNNKQVFPRSAGWCRVLLQLHDELVLETNEDDVFEVVEVCRPLMENAWKNLILDLGCFDDYVVTHQLFDAKLGVASTSREGRRPRVHGGVGGGARQGPVMMTGPEIRKYCKQLLDSRTLPTKVTIADNWGQC